MKYYIDFTTIKDKYNYQKMSLYFDNFEDYVFNLATIKKEDHYKIVDCGMSWGWEKGDLAEKVNDLIGEIK